MPGTRHAPAPTECPTASDTLAAAHRIAAGVAAEQASVVDRQASFPTAAVDALAEAGLLAAAAPEHAGGLGLGVRALAPIASVLAQGCGSTAMIWAMHQLQLACLVRHGGLERAGAVDELLATIVRKQLLLASVTTEKGVGDLRRSRACVEPAGDRYALAKDAPTVSYGQQAGAFLLSARRGPTSPEHDQVAVLVHRDQMKAALNGRWNPMGMRGTCSPGFLLQATFDADQILRDPFGQVAERTLVPMSEILWSAVWIGLATGALARAAAYLHERGGRAGTAVIDRRMAHADQILVGLEAQLADAIDRYEAIEHGAEQPSARLRMRLHALKLAASTSTVEVASLALAICGFAGYQEDGPFSIARPLRDLYSGQVMVSNDKLLDVNAQLAVTSRMAGPG